MDFLREGLKVLAEAVMELEVAHILLVYRYRQLQYRGGLLEFARRVEVGLFAPVPSTWVRITA